MRQQFHYVADTCHDFNYVHPHEMTLRALQHSGPKILQTSAIDRSITYFVVGDEYFYDKLNIRI